jgi:uncharacterized membrane protein (UPF0127 family)
LVTLWRAGVAFRRWRGFVGRRFIGDRTSANVSNRSVSCHGRAFVRRSAALLLGFVLLGLGWAGVATAQTLDKLEIMTSTGVHVFSVEMAQTDAEREKGLMYRRFMPPDRGMLFDFKREEPVMFWMKNTYIPLDMIFISRAGVVTSIVADAEPLSERLIPSDGPCYGVLEVNAGVAASIGVKPGDKVRHPIFTP